MTYIDYIIAFILAFIISLSSTPIARKISFRTGAIDMPDGDRKIHKKPVARLGGLAIISGVIITLVYFIITGNYQADFFIATPRQFAGIFAGVSIIAITGIIDDIRGVGPKLKFLMQTVAALCMVLISGMKIEVVTNPFTEINYTILPDFISYPVTILWIIGITNAINLIDGLDGLASGITAISCISLFFINIIANQGANFTPLVAILAITLAGSSLGFLPFNFFPSKIIMGDSGAYFMGFILGILSIQGALKSYTAVSISMPLIVLGLPILDTFSSIIRRVFRGKSFMAADRGHIHHKLIDMGLSQKQSVIVMYTATAALGLSAIVMAYRSFFSALLLLVLASVFVIGGAFFLRELNEDREPEIKIKEIPAEKIE